MDLTTAAGLAVEYEDCNEGGGQQAADTDADKCSHHLESDGGPPVERHPAALGGCGAVPGRQSGQHLCVCG